MAEAEKYKHELENARVIIPKDEQKDVYSSPISFMNVVQASSLDRQDAHPTNQIRLLYIRTEIITQ